MIKFVMSITRHPDMSREEFAGHGNEVILNDQR